ncbi:MULTISPECIES: biotin-dependent carboxyltransferase family protein [Streptomyces]|uniref:Biotin-dependent carboxyltransferase n=2 Tax=Streptomyces TaxID=1883 RepID=A0A3R7LKE4_9ACTN|nr:MULTISPECIES: biotin-dependent carboxyltransferase family protein [Streptomyces]KNE83877.1 allophanate hydrolase [Streptomyces fradiae]OFA55755.1 allophanate hydrolase [Streptomyces fradiae]PQM23890.1 allophanate hydrolase [Streptomyces xinghaiensis]RKM92000.1 biotin-dependent carboxyltransferase [Streptomyces xinghaiensis]RNC73582.1 biotin-dependent carboxyltransferase [Streptomyces xinghaiensis]
MAIEILNPGLASSIQDRGRPGYYEVGIPPSGAVDLYSSLAANLLVGNDDGAALIEAAYMGPELRFTAPAVVAVTGAAMPVKVNGRSAPQWESFDIGAGDVLSFGFLEHGARIYIAVSGGIDVPLVLGSRSTYALGAFGGFDGRTLKAGDVLATGTDTGSGRSGRAVPENLRPELSRELELRVMLGLYDYRLTPAGLTALLDTTWTLTPVADRVGFRYSGGTLEWQERVQPFGAGSDPSNIVDAGYPLGSIQVPGGVEPIILHRDAVSGGGYAMVATVISADLDAVGQSAPGSRTRFCPVSMEQALQARAATAARVQRLRTALS